MSYVYIVLFADGKIKAGKTANIVKRINSHISIGSQFGVSIECFFFCHIGEGYSNAEIKILKECDIIFKKISGEFYEGANYESAYSVIKKIGDPIHCGVQISNGNLGLPRVATYIKGFSLPQSRENITLESKIYNLIKMNKKITYGVIKNRLRRTPDCDINYFLEKMTSEGVIIKDEHLHIKKNCSIYTYSLK